jgi:hypothetical protein
MSRFLRRLSPTGRWIAAHRLCRPDSYLRGVGWFESFRRRLPVDGGGEPLPWYTYPAIAFLQPRIGSAMAVFEYGSGQSTLWWSRRVERVVSCEHNRQWFERMRGQLPANVSYRLIELDPPGPYAQAIAEYAGQFDIIVIDGRQRIACCRNCLGSLKSGGVILWDNSERAEYAAGYDFLAAHDFRRLNFVGMGPSSAVGWETSIFYRQQNCLGI